VAEVVPVLAQAMEGQAKPWVLVCAQAACSPFANLALQAGFPRVRREEHRQVVGWVLSSEASLGCILRLRHVWTSLPSVPRSRIVELFFHLSAFQLRPAVFGPRPQELC